MQNVVGARSTLPILSNVLLIAGDNKLELRATDLEVSINASVPAKVEVEGASSLPAKRLFGLVREIEAVCTQNEALQQQLSAQRRGGWGGR